MQNSMETLAKKVRLYRTARGFTQEKLAEKVEISEPYISRIETGKSCNLTIDTLYRLAEVLEVKVIDLLTEGDSKTHLINESYYDIMEFLRQEGIESLALLKHRIAMDNDEQNALISCRIAKSGGWQNELHEIAQYEIKRRLKQANPDTKPTEKKEA